jgi:hypothetical protein
VSAAPRGRPSQSSTAASLRAKSFCTGCSTPDGWRAALDYPFVSRVLLARQRARLAVELELPPVLVAGAGTRHTLQTFPLAVLGAHEHRQELVNVVSVGPGPRARRFTSMLEEL